MDMALELGNSISSLDARMQQRMKASMVDGRYAEARARRRPAQPQGAARGGR